MRFCRRDFLGEKTQIPGLWDLGIGIPKNPISKPPLILTLNLCLEHRWKVLQIGFWYIIATMGSFQAFTMLAPAAALGARCSSRTFFSVLLSMFWLKEKILKLEWISGRISHSSELCFQNYFKIYTLLTAITNGPLVMAHKFCLLP